MGNRLTGVSGAATATFVYDGDGQRVKGTVGGVTTAYIGKYYEYSGGAAKKYYSAGGVRVAMNDAGTVRYLLGDHLGSTTITADTAGVRVAELLYKAWGENRYTFSTTPTTLRYTGQRQESGLGGADGLYYYGARWYDPAISRFIQADTVVPQLFDPQSLNRYSYSLSNPLKYTDPSGHCVDGLTTLACIALGVGIALKVIDYGWTAYDGIQSAITLADPNAGGDAKMFAALNVSLAVIFEAGEPDDFLPAGLPLDDVARRAVMKGAKEAYEEGGEAALRKFLKDQLGEHADDVLQKLGLGRTFDPKDISHVFDNPRHGLDDLVKAFGNQNDAYGAIYDEFAKVAGNYTQKQLHEGIEVVVGGFTVTVRGDIVDGIARIGTAFIVPK